jgi:hypothetical protein
MRRVEVGTLDRWKCAARGSRAGTKCISRRVRRETREEHAEKDHVEMSDTDQEQNYQLSFVRVAN